QGHAVFADRWGQQQSLLVVSEKRNIIRTLPPVVKLKAADKEIVARPDTWLACRLLLERTPNFTGPMRIELASSSTDFIAEPLTIEANQNMAVVKVHVATDARRNQSAVLRFRASGRHSTNTPIVSEASLKVIWE